MASDSVPPLQDKPALKILLLRFSAMGDVAMTAAALREYAPVHPNIRFTMVSRPLFAPFFTGMNNVAFMAVDFKKNYKGLAGIWRLFHTLRRQKPDVVADMHDVLRTKILCLLFRLWGFKVKKINKGRAEKYQLTRRHHKQLKPLKNMLERYSDVLLAATGRAAITAKNSVAAKPVIETAENKVTHLVKIGVAPFAKYKEKIYPLERMEKVVAHFAHLKNVEILLFGGGAEEIGRLAEWESKYAGVTSLAGKMSLSEELMQLSTMDVVISMDSANMHMASLVGVPVVSIWGATHPFVGFTGWKQPETNNIQIDLYCRPCSVFGNKPCFRHDYACMNIPEQVIIDKITAILEAKL